MEVGNSGMFRPEMLRPMGLPENVNVIAWGLSLERPTMILYGVRPPGGAAGGGGRGGWRQAVAGCCARD